MAQKMLINADKYASSLKRLWSEVFGDSDEYISLIFDKGYTPAEVFGAISGEEVVSALYLLRCHITVGEKTLKGRYLYAAATLKEYRKKGIMGKLIDEAKEYISDEKIDFIALVPASEELYAYYAKHGFETNMYKYVATSSIDGRNKTEDAKIEDAEIFCELRNCYKGKNISFEIPEMKYALSCLDFAGYNVYSNTEDSYYISDKDRTEIIEYISSEENFRRNTEILFSKLNPGVEISSPYNLGEFLQCERRKFGMIFSDSMIYGFDGGIYMNIALD